ncbi:MAG: FRG domain-containing protein [Phycisphaerales bacterium]
MHKFVDSVEKLANMPRLSPENAALLFRAQGSKLPYLKPKLWEQLQKDGIAKEDALRIEFDTISYFKARARTYLDPRLIPQEHDVGEWLALMQHYGAPTRMLDWTTSLNVALYFAVARREGSGDSEDGAVWFFETGILLDLMKEMKPYLKEQYAQICADRESFVAFGLNRARPNVWAYYPDLPTDRMLAQGGILTFSEQPLCDHALLIGQALLHYRKEHPKFSGLVKLVIPAEAKAALREYLIKIDVHASTLFPGLDGIGNTIREMIELETKAHLPRAS